MHVVEKKKDQMKAISHQMQKTLKSLNYIFCRDFDFHFIYFMIIYVEKRDVKIEKVDFLRVVSEMGTPKKKTLFSSFILTVLKTTNIKDTLY